MFPAPGATWIRARNLIYLATAAYLVAGAAAFVWLLASGNFRWLVFYLHVPGAVLLVSLAAGALWLSYCVRCEFTSGEPLQTAWQLVCAAAAVELLGEIGSQLLGPDSKVNPLWRAPWWSPKLANAARDWGLFLGGPCRFGLMAAGFLFALKVYQRAGFLGRLRALDWTMLIGAALYTGVEIAYVALAILNGKRPGLAEIAHFPTDPLLVLLLVEGLFLYRSVQEMGPGLIGACWKTFSIGVFLIVLGDLSIMFLPYVAWPWSALGSFIWFPAAAAFAVAPTFQLEAIAKARASRSRP